jgi:hypothetical protein
MRGIPRVGVPVRRAVRIAPAADTVSVAVMELTGSTVMAGVPGAVDAGLSDALFQVPPVLFLALAAAVTVPRRPVDDRPRRGTRGRARLPLTPVRVWCGRTGQGRPSRPMGSFSEPGRPP